MSELMRKENDQIVSNFLERTFFSAWKPENKCEEKYANYRGLELQVNGSCDLKCKYCYYAKYQKELYPSNIAGKSNILKNLNMVLDWLEKNNYQPDIELFSGELFFQDVGFEVLDRVIDWQIERGIDNRIIVPTNFSFIYDDEKIARIEDAFERFPNIFLSVSIDGKYCDANRPFIDGKIRDDEYYDKMFKFAKKWGFGFHPMIYSDNIEKWKDNWLWFQENFKKYDIAFDKIYLLEVRNVEWNERQLKEFYKFVRFLMNWTWDFVKDVVAPEKFPIYLFDQQLFNIFNIFSSAGRGMGCSMQSVLQLRLGDLTTSICHRAAYKAQNLWRFRTENDQIKDIEALNYNLYTAVASMDYKNSPFCNYCSIRELCSGQCLGAMYEANSDPFVPIPTVCALEHARVAAVLDEIKDLGLDKHFYAWATQKQKSMKVYYEYLRRG